MQFCSRVDVRYRETERRIRGCLSLEGEEKQVIYSLWDMEMGEGDGNDACQKTNTCSESIALRYQVRVTNCGLRCILHKHRGFRILGCLL